MTRHHPHVVLRDDQTVLLAVLRAAVESATSSPRDDEEDRGPQNTA